MDNLLLYPPVIFVTAFLFVCLFSILTKSFKMKSKDADSKGKLDPYACGEDYEEKKIEPDYKSFFPVAIFFTVLHVAGLTIATLANSSFGLVTAAFAAVYVLGILVVLGMLYAK
ncbi:NADH-quinone oxidoreductase subunit A [Parelusimicrobium proximum]|uniref:NADH-quinone oxidoreductase subunit A n=1 Tax=Parelusimicrobium proximum TaxID=3228953 RepID=UPI003D166FA6